MMANPLHQTSPGMAELYARLRQAGPPPPRPRPAPQPARQVADVTPPDGRVESAVNAAPAYVEPFDVMLVRHAYGLVRRFLIWLIWPLWRYADIRSFILAHASGRLKSNAAEARYAHCAKCAHLQVKDGIEYCHGDNGGRGCGCGEHCFSKLRWKLKLRAWSCPIGHFGKGES